MCMALISTDEVCIWLYDNLPYSVTENFITRILQYILIFTCGNLSQIIIENETVFAVIDIVDSALVAMTTLPQALVLRSHAELGGILDEPTK